MIYLKNAQKAPGTVPEFPVVPPGLNCVPELSEYTGLYIATILSV